MIRKIRVVVADDHIYAMEGLLKIVSDAKDMECVGSTTELLELPALVKKKKPDALVLDIDWLGDRQAGIHILPDLRNIQPKLPVVTITVYPELIELARQAGTYPLSKGFSRHDLWNAIRWAIRQKDSQSETTPAGVELVSLTPAERKILGLLSKKDQQIAVLLGRSEGTIKKHVSNILRKLGVRSRTEAAIMAERYGLIEKK